MKKLFAFIFISALAISFAVAGTFEIGPKVGYKNFDEDAIDNDIYYGIQGAYNIDENMKVKLTYDVYSTDELKSDIDIDSLFAEFDYLWPVEKLSYFAGAGIGMAFPEFEAADVDNAFIYGVTGGVIYNINNNWNVGFDAGLFYGESDVKNYGDVDLDNWSAAVSLNYKLESKNQ